MKTKQEQLLLPSTSAVLSIGWWQKACYLSLFLSRHLLSLLQSRVECTDIPTSWFWVLLYLGLEFGFLALITDLCSFCLKLFLFGILTINTLPQSFVAYYFGAYIDSLGSCNENQPLSAALEIWSAGCMTEWFPIYRSGDFISRMHDWIASQSTACYCRPDRIPPSAGTDWFLVSLNFITSLQRFQCIIIACSKISDL